MKNVLLTTTALVAFAGAAVAADVEVTYTGDATVEYSFDDEQFQGELNFGIDLMLTQELNNGAVASLSLPVVWQIDEVSLADGSVSIDDPDIDWVAMLETSYGSISFGQGISDVNNGAFSVVAGMDVFGGDDYDEDYEGESIVFGHDTDWWGDTHEVRAETTLSGWTIMASADVNLDVMSMNATGSMGAIDLGVFYETSVWGDSSMGATASGAFGALSYDVAFAANSGWSTATSTGIGIGYAVSDAISVSASHAINSDVADETAVGVAYDGGAITGSADYDVDAAVLDLEAGYTMEVQAGTTVSLGLTVEDATGAALVGYSIDVAYVDGDLGVYAGYNDVDGTYAGVNYDLGGGANAYVHMSDFADAGPLEWGTDTVAGISISF